MPDLALTKLDDLAVLSARGADAVKFLQGQLSQDLAPLLDGDAVLAGLHNPQGRCIAVLRVLRVTREQLLLVLPAELAEPVRQVAYGVAMTWSANQAAWALCTAFRSPVSANCSCANARMVSSMSNRGPSGLSTKRTRL